MSCTAHGLGSRCERSLILDLIPRTRLRSQKILNFPRDCGTRYSVPCAIDPHRDHLLRSVASWTYVLPSLVVQATYQTSSTSYVLERNAVALSLKPVSQSGSSMPAYKWNHKAYLHIAFFPLSRHHPRQPNGGSSPLPLWHSRTSASHGL